MLQNVSLSDFNALLLVVTSFCVLLVDPVFKSQPRVLVAAWLTIAAHHTAAFAEAFLFRINPAMGDHLMFHAEAVNMAGESHQTYANLLHFVYSFFGPSILIGEECSILAYTVGLMVFVRIGRELGMEENRLAPLVLLYGLLPSMVIHGSLTLRESYQATSFLAAIYSLIAFKRTGAYSWLAAFAVSGYCLNALHHGLTVFVVFLMLAGLYWVARYRATDLASLLLVPMIALPVFFPSAIQRLSESSAVLRQVTTDGGLTYVSEVRSALKQANARTEYGIEIDGSSAPALLATGGMAFFAYMFYPLPWKMSSPLDIYAFAEVVLRSVLLVGAMVAIRTAPPERRDLSVLILGASLALEAIWSAGTSNWGTAIRHHTVAYGPLLLVGGQYLTTLQLDASRARLLARQERRRLLEARQIAH